MIEIDFNNLREAYLCGHIGEHNAEQILITLKEEMIDKTAKYVITFSSGNTTVYESKPMSVVGNDNLLFTIPYEVTSIPVGSTSNIVEMQICQYKSNRLIRKSDHINIIFSGNSNDKKHRFEDKHHGHPCKDHHCHCHEHGDSDNTDDVHPNKEVLDSISDENGYLKYKDKVILPNSTAIIGNSLDYSIHDNSLFYLQEDYTNSDGDIYKRGLYIYTGHKFISISGVSEDSGSGEEEEIPDIFELVDGKIMFDDNSEFIEVDENGRVYIYECDDIEINGDRVEVYVNEQ